MALGAPREQVVGLIVREGMTVSVIGIAVGVGTALVVNRVLASLVFDIAVRDPITYVAVAVALALVALVACAIPALKASRVDPLVAARAGLGLGASLDKRERTVRRVDGREVRGSGTKVRPFECPAPR